MERTEASSPAFGPWVSGIINVVPPHEVPLSGLVDAVNCDISRTGAVTSRRQWTLLDGDAPYSDLLFYNGALYGRRGSELGQVTADAFVASRTANRFGSWATLGDSVVYCDYNGVYSYVGPELLYSPPIGASDDSRMVSPMPGGSAVAFWNGRLLVARGQTLYWSEPYELNSCVLATNYVRLGAEITWMAALDSGVYVGLPETTLFLRGSDPFKFEVSTVSGPSCPKASAVVSTEYMPPSISDRAPQVALWFSDVGFVVGLPNGSVLYPQADRLSGLAISPRRLVVDDDRVYVFLDEA